MDPAVNLQKSCRSLLQCGEKSLLCRLFSTQHLCLWRTVCSTLVLSAVHSAQNEHHTSAEISSQSCVFSLKTRHSSTTQCYVAPASLDILNCALFTGCHILSLHPCVVLSGVQLFILFSRNAIRRPLKSCKRVTKILQHSKTGCRNGTQKEPEMGSLRNHCDLDTILSTQVWHFEPERCYMDFGETNVSGYQNQNDGRCHDNVSCLYCLYILSATA